MHPTQLNSFALTSINQASATQAELRRAISALYYGLFHTFAEQAAELVGGPADLLKIRVARSLDHRTMLDVCKPISRHQPGVLQGILVESPDPRLASVATAFIRLQEGRHAADYDLSLTFTRQNALDYLQLAVSASTDWHAMRSLPERRAFLVALLLGDRLKRRG